MDTNTKRARFLLVSVIALTLAMAASIAGMQPAAAHAAPTTRATQQITMTINGRTYITSPGASVRLPTTYADGSKGWIYFSAGTTPAVSPDTVTCTTAYATQSWTNLVGTVLIKYTLSQYWCFDGTNIVSYEQPGDTYQTNLGWSLANSAEAITQYPTPQWARSAGTFRFNGPFGVGCKSGENTIYWYGTGLHSNEYNQNSYYGC